MIVFEKGADPFFGVNPVSYWANKTAIVTGAASGIGRGLVHGLRARGAFVVAGDLTPAADEEQLDVRDLAAITALVSRTITQRGRLDFLFNNAGVAVAGETHELTREHWDFVLDVNVNGVVNGILAAYPQMVRQKSGHIINVASLAGLAAAPLLVPYAASKHAVVGLSTSLRVEAADHNVRVSVVCPAAIDTPMLDRDNPAHLPPISWRPNIRRYLTRLGGAPHDVGKFVDEALAGVEDNKAVIVIPGRARLAWRMGRWAPALVNKLVLDAVRFERNAPS